jgi:predicted N-acetyltransferase YhbS
MQEKLRSDIHVVVALDGEHCVGCVEIDPSYGDNKVSIGMLSVDPNRQGEGIGRELFNAAEKVAVQKFKVCIDY